MGDGERLCMSTIDDGTRPSGVLAPASPAENQRTSERAGRQQLMRCAVDQLTTARERVAEYLDRPTAARMAAAQQAVQHFVHFESFEIIDSVSSVDLDPESARPLVAGHHQLELALNRLAWSTPGTHQGGVEAHDLRRQLIRQMDRYANLLGTGTGVDPAAHPIESAQSPMG